MVCANDANDRTNTSEKQSWESSPARIILPRILEIANHFKNTFGNEPKKLLKVKSNECIRKNVWFHKKKSQQSGMDFLKKCFKQALAPNRNYRNSKSNIFKEGNFKKEKGRKGVWKIDKLIDHLQHSVREKLKDIENIYKHILMFEQNNRGNPRMT